MSAPALSVQSVGKCYSMRHSGTGSARLALEQAVRMQRSASRDNVRWALEDISFEVGQGEVVALMGRNGAGKSVLFKILARVTRPTTRRVEIRGASRPSSKWAPPFIPISPAVKTFTSTESFWECAARRSTGTRLASSSSPKSATFWTRPSAQYSSGMRMRLAFAVAAHLESAISFSSMKSWPWAIAITAAVSGTGCAELAAQGRTIRIRQPRQ